MNLLAHSSLHALRSPLAVLYRVMVAFLLGYLCTYFFTINLTDLFHHYLPKAESIYLAAFIAILFYLGFVIMIFCIQTLKKMSMISMSILLILFVASKWIS